MSTSPKQIVLETRERNKRLIQKHLDTYMVYKADRLVKGEPVFRWIHIQQIHDDDYLIFARSEIPNDKNVTSIREMLQILNRKTNPCQTITKKQYEEKVLEYKMKLHVENNNG